MLGKKKWNWKQLKVNGVGECSLDRYYQIPKAIEALASTSLPAFDENGGNRRECSRAGERVVWFMGEPESAPVDPRHGMMPCRFGKMLSVCLILAWSICSPVRKWNGCSGPWLGRVRHGSGHETCPGRSWRKISKMLPDKYFCNFSLFQSLPDSWAIDQIFPDYTDFSFERAAD